jgi:hypothetical protein
VIYWYQLLQSSHSHHFHLISCSSSLPAAIPISAPVLRTTATTYVVTHCARAGASSVSTRRSQLRRKSCFPSGCTRRSWSVPPCTCPSPRSMGCDYVKCASFCNFVSSRRPIGTLPTNTLNPPSDWNCITINPLPAFLPPGTSCCRSALFCSPGKIHFAFFF